MHTSKIYRLYNDTESHIFMSEKEACNFINSRQGYISKQYCLGYKAKGYNIERIGVSTHNLSKTRLYHIWKSMIHRCTSKIDISYKHYGGRGITVCDEWSDTNENGFMNFYNWANENGYTENLSIDRIDNDGNYEPNNCRWATLLEQGSNMSHSLKIFDDGEYLSVMQFALKHGIPKATIHGRLREGRDLLTGKINKGEQ